MSLESVRPLLPTILLVLGVGFLAANLRLLLHFVRFLRLRSSAVLTWPGRKPPFYGVALALGVILGVLVFYKLAIQRFPPKEVFGEGMMFLYYAYALPLSLRIGRGFYEEGIWAEGGFIRYEEIGGLTWREEPDITLVVISRMRNLARRLTVPRAAYAEARRLLRDKIAAHAIHFTGSTLNLGEHDEREDV